MHFPHLETILSHFVKPPGDIVRGQECFTTVNVAEHYRGDGTESSARHMRAALGDEKYSHYNYDTWACNGFIFLRIPRYRLPGAPIHETPLSAPHLWALSAIEECDPEAAVIRPKLLETLTPWARHLLSEIVGLEVTDIRKVEVWQSGRTTRRVKQKVPTDAVYFRFPGGSGLALKPKGVTDAEG